MKNLFKNIIIFLTMAISFAHAKDFNIVASKDSHIDGDVKVFINCYNRKYREALASGKKFGPNNPIKKYMERYEHMDILEAFLNQCDIPDSLLPPSDLDLLFQRFGQDFNITDYKLNKPPVILARGPQNTPFEYDNVTLSIRSGKYLDPSPQKYIWTQISGPTPRKEYQEGSTLHLQLPRFHETNRKMVYKIVAIDGYGKSDYDIVSFDIVKSPLIADIGKDRTVVENSNVTVDSIVSDRRELPRTYHWEQISGPDINISNTSALSITFTAPTYVPAIQPIVLKLTVENSEGNLAFAETSIFIKSQAEIEAEKEATKVFSITPQTVITSPNQTSVITPEIRDDFADVTNYYWEQTSGPNVKFLFSSNYEKDVVVKVPGYEENNNIVTLKLTVRDARGESKSQTFRIKIQSDELKISNIVTTTDKNGFIHKTPIIENHTTDGNTTLSYLWFVNSGEPFVDENNISVCPTNNKELIFKNKKWYPGIHRTTYTLMVKNAEGKTVNQTMIHDYESPEAAISVFSLENIAAEPLETITLTPTVKNLDIVSYKWKKISGPDIIFLNNSENKKTATIKTPVWSEDKRAVTIACTGVDKKGISHLLQAIISLKNQPASPGSTTINGEDINNTVYVSVDGISLLSEETGTLYVKNGYGEEVSSFTWSQVYGPGIKFVSKSKERATIVAPKWSSRNEVAILKFTITFKDGKKFEVPVNISPRSENSSSAITPDVLVSKQYAPPATDVYIAYTLKNIAPDNVDSIELSKLYGPGTVSPVEGTNAFSIRTPETFDEWSGDKKILYNLKVTLKDGTSIEKQNGIYPLGDKKVSLSSVYINNKESKAVTPIFEGGLNSGHVKEIEWLLSNKGNADIALNDSQVIEPIVTVTNWGASESADINATITFKDNTSKNISAKILKPVTEDESGEFSEESIEQVAQDFSVIASAPGNVEEGKYFNIHLEYQNGSPKSVTVSQTKGIVASINDSNATNGIITIHAPRYSESAPTIEYSIEALSEKDEKATTNVSIRVKKIDYCSEDSKDPQCLATFNCKNNPSSKECAPFCSTHPDDDMCSVDVFNSDEPMGFTEGERIAITGLKEDQRDDRYSYLWEQTAGTEINDLEYINSEPVIHLIVPPYDKSNAQNNTVELRFTVSTETGGSTSKTATFNVLRAIPPMEKFLKKCDPSGYQNDIRYYWNPETKTYNRYFGCPKRNLNDEDMKLLAASGIEKIQGDLDLSNNPNITSLEFLSNIEITNSVLLNGCHIKNLNGLTNKNKTIHGTLNLSNNDITSLDPLADLTNVTDVLDLSYNNITDLSPLSNLSDINTLNISHNPLGEYTNFSPIKDLNIVKDFIVSRQEYKIPLSKDDKLCKKYFDQDTKQFICPERTEDVIISDFFNRINRVNNISNFNADTGTLRIYNISDTKGHGINNYTAQFFTLVREINGNLNLEYNNITKLNNFKNLKKINGFFSLSGLNIKNPDTDFIKDLLVSSTIYMPNIGEFPLRKQESNTTFCQNDFRSIREKTLYCESSYSFNDIIHYYCKINGSTVSSQAIKSYFSEDNTTLNGNLNCNIPKNYETLPEMQRTFDINGSYNANDGAIFSNIEKVYGDLSAKSGEFKKLTYVKGNVETSTLVSFPKLVEIKGSFYPNYKGLPFNKTYFSEPIKLKRAGELQLSYPMSSFEGIKDLNISGEVYLAGSYPEKQLESNSTLCKAKFRDLYEKEKLCGELNVTDFFKNRCGNNFDINKYNMQTGDYNGSLSCNFSIDDMPYLANSEIKIRKILGDLTLSGIGTLPYLEEIDGALTINNKSSLGVPQVKKVASYIRIYNDGTGLDSLISIGDHTTPSFNQNIINHLTSLKKANSIYIKENIKSLRAIKDLNTSKLFIDGDNNGFSTLESLLDKNSTLCQSANFFPASAKEKICASSDLWSIIMAHCEDGYYIKRNFNKKERAVTRVLKCSFDKNLLNGADDTNVIEKTTNDIIFKESATIPSIRESGSVALYDNSGLPDIETIHGDLYMDTTSTLPKLKKVEGTITFTKTHEKNIPNLEEANQISFSPVRNEDADIFTHIKHIGTLVFQNGSLIDNLTFLKNLNVSTVRINSDLVSSTPKLDGNSTFCQAHFTDVTKKLKICQTSGFRDLIVRYCNKTAEDFDREFNRTSKTYNGSLICSIPNQKNENFRDMHDFKIINGNLKLYGKWFFPYITKINGSVEIKSGLNSFNPIEINGSLSVDTGVCQIFPDLQTVSETLTTSYCANFPNLIDVNNLKNRTHKGKHSSFPKLQQLSGNLILPENDNSELINLNNLTLIKGNLENIGSDEIETFDKIRNLKIEGVVKLGGKKSKTVLDKNSTFCQNSFDFAYRKKQACETNTSDITSLCTELNGTKLSKDTFNSRFNPDTGIYTGDLYCKVDYTEESNVLDAITEIDGNLTIKDRKVVFKNLKSIKGNLSINNIFNQTISPTFPELTHIGKFQHNVSARFSYRDGSYFDQQNYPIRLFPKLSSVDYIKLKKPSYYDNIQFPIAHIFKGLSIQVSTLQAPRDIEWSYIKNIQADEIELEGTPPARYDINNSTPICQSLFDSDKKAHYAICTGGTTEGMLEFICGISKEDFANNFDKNTQTYNGDLSCTEPTPYKTNFIADNGIKEINGSLTLRRPSPGSYIPLHIEKIKGSLDLEYVSPILSNIYTFTKLKYVNGDITVNIYGPRNKIIRIETDTTLVKGNFKILTYEEKQSTSSISDEVFHAPNTKVLGDINANFYPILSKKYDYNSKFCQNNFTSTKLRNGFCGKTNNYKDTLIRDCSLARKTLEANYDKANRTYNGNLSCDFKNTKWDEISDVNSSILRINGDLTIKGSHPDIEEVNGTLTASDSANIKASKVSKLKVDGNNLNITTNTVKQDAFLESYDSKSKIRIGNIDGDLYYKKPGLYSVQSFPTLSNESFIHTIKGNVRTLHISSNYDNSYYLRFDYIDLIKDTDINGSIEMNPTVKYKFSADDNFCQRNTFADSDIKARYCLDANKSIANIKDLIVERCGVDESEYDNAFDTQTGTLDLNLTCGFEKGDMLKLMSGDIEDNIKKINGNINPSDYFTLTNLSEVNGSVTVPSSFRGLFPSLINIKKDFLIQYKPYGADHQERVDSFKNLKTIEGNLIYSGYNTAHIFNLDNLEHIGGDLVIGYYEYSAVYNWEQELPYIQKLKTIKGNIKVNRYSSDGHYYSTIYIPSLYQNVTISGSFYNDSNVKYPKKLRLRDGIKKFKASSPFCRNDVFSSVSEKYQVCELTEKEKIELFCNKTKQQISQEFNTTTGAYNGSLMCGTDDKIDLNISKINGDLQLLNSGITLSNLQEINGSLSFHEYSYERRLLPKGRHFFSPLPSLTNVTENITISEPYWHYNISAIELPMLEKNTKTIRMTIGLLNLPSLREANIFILDQTNHRHSNNNYSDYNNKPATTYPSLKKINTLKLFYLRDIAYDKIIFPILNDVDTIEITGNSNAPVLSKKIILPVLNHGKTLFFNDTRGAIQSINTFQDISIENVIANSNDEIDRLNPTKLPKNSIFCQNSGFMTETLKSKLCSEHNHYETYDSLQKLLDEKCGDINESTFNNNYDADTRTYYGDLICDFSKEDKENITEDALSALLSIKGNLNLEGTGGFTYLKDINGSLLINNVGNEGLPSLTEVLGDISSKNHLKGLDSLQHIGGNLLLTTKDPLQLDNLNSISLIEGQLKTFSQNDDWKLESFKNLSNTEIDGGIIVPDNSFSYPRVDSTKELCQNTFKTYKLKGNICKYTTIKDYIVSACDIDRETFDANFDNSRGVYTGDLICDQEEAGIDTNIKDKNSLTKITGNLTIKGFFNLPFLDEINGTLDIYSKEDILGKLKTVNGDVIAQDNALIPNSLDKISGSLTIHHVKSSKTDLGGHNLTEIGGDLSIVLPKQMKNWLCHYNSQTIVSKNKLLSGFTHLLNIGGSLLTNTKGYSSGYYYSDWNECPYKEYEIELPNKLKNLSVTNSVSVPWENRKIKLPKTELICQNNFTESKYKSYLCQGDDLATLIEDRCGYPKDQFLNDFNETTGSLYGDLNCRFTKNDLPGMTEAAQKLKKVFGNVNISGFTEFPSLEYIGGDLIMEDYSKLNNLKDVTGKATLKDRTQTSVEKISGDLWIEETAMANNLQYIGGNAQIRSKPDLQSLVTVKGNINVTTKDQRLKNLQFVGGDMSINTGIYESIFTDGYDNLKEVNGSLTINSNPNDFTKIKDLSVRGEITSPSSYSRNKLDENSSLCQSEWTSLYEKEKVCESTPLATFMSKQCNIDKDYFINHFDKNTGEYNGSLTCKFKSELIPQVPYIAQIKKINGSLELQEEAEFPKIQEVTGSVALNNNSQLPSLTTIGGDFNLYSRRGAPNLKTVSGTLTVNKFINPHSLESLETIGGDFKNRYSSNYGWVLNLTSLKTIKGNFISTDATIDYVTPFEFVTIGGDIFGNFSSDIAQKIDGLSPFCQSHFINYHNYKPVFWKNRVCDSLSLQEVFRDQCDISENDFNASVSDNGTYHGDIGCNMPEGMYKKIRDMQKITEVNGSVELRGAARLPSVRSVTGNIAIYDKAKMDSLKFVGGAATIASEDSAPNLETITGDLTLYKAGFLDHLKFIGGDLIISGPSNTLEHLSSLTQISGSLIFNYNLNIPVFLSQLNVGDLVNLDASRITIDGYFDKDSSFCKSEFKDSVLKTKICNSVSMRDIVSTKCDDVTKDIFDENTIENTYTGDLSCHFTKDEFSKVEDKDAIQEINGTLTINSSGAFSEVKTINGNLNILTRESVEMPYLEKVTGDVKATYSGANAKLNKLKEIGGDFIIHDRNIAPYLESVGGILHIETPGRYVVFETLKRAGEITIANCYDYFLRNFHSLEQTGSLTISTGPVKDFMPIKNTIVSAINLTSNNEKKSEILLPADSNLCQATFNNEDYKNNICQTPEE